MTGKASFVKDPGSRYDLREQLGKGSYGSVYKAIEVATSEVVAVKIIPLSATEADGFAEIQKEIDTLQMCKHPNIVNYKTSLRTDSALWIVMEHCGGGSVTDLIASTGLALEENVIAYICREALKGLAYLHTMGKVHRDIKGGNVLLTDTGAVKLADFGVAAQLTNTMSKRNTFIGTPHWMAPEVIQESRYDGKVDVWALGVSAIEMAETIPPRWSVHPMRVIFQISREDPPRLADWEKWSLNFHDFVRLCLVKEPRQRPTAAQLLQHRMVTQSAAAGVPDMGPLVQKARAFISAKAAVAADTFSTTLAGSTVQADRQSWVPQRTAVLGGGTAHMGPQDEEGTVVRHSAAPSLAYDGTVVRHSTAMYDGTAVVHSSTPGRPSPIDAGGSDYGTAVVHSAAATPAGRSSAADSTVVFSNAGTPGGGYQDALRVADAESGTPAKAAAASPGSAYMAALASAAASGAPEPMSASVAASSPTPGRGKSAVQKMIDRLDGVCESGNVVPVAFLSAAAAAPLALVDHAPPPVRAAGGAGAAASAGAAHQLVSELAEDSRLDAVPQQLREQLKKQARTIDPEIAKQLDDNPVLLNLARTLLFHKQQLADAPLAAAARAAQGRRVQDLTEMLRTIMCL